MGYCGLPDCRDKGNQWVEQLFYSALSELSINAVLTSWLVHIQHVTCVTFIKVSILASVSGSAPSKISLVAFPIAIGLSIKINYNEEEVAQIFGSSLKIVDPECLTG